MRIGDFCHRWNVIKLSVALVLSVPFAEVVAQPAVMPAIPESWVSDLTGTLDDSSVLVIEKVCQTVAEQSTGEIFVSVIPTTSGEEHREFATRLFNTWKIGDKADDNGVLIFVALEDRATEVILGEKIDGDQHVALARDIVSDYMLPQFRAGNPSRAIREATIQSAKSFFPGVQLPADATKNVDLDAGLAADNFQQVRPQPVNANRNRNPRPAIGRKNPMKDVLWWGGGLSGVTGLGFGVRRYRRKRARKCDACGIEMELLGEVEDDDHLTEREQSEERLGSVDYDIWSCPECASVKKLTYGAIFTRYARCPECQAKTMSSTTDTIRHATTARRGLKEITEDCHHCNFHNVRRRSTPRKSKSSGSSGRRSSGSRGGGSSRGRGASGKW